MLCECGFRFVQYCEFFELWDIFGNGCVILNFDEMVLGCLGVFLCSCEVFFSWSFVLCVEFVVL